MLNTINPNQGFTVHLRDLERQRDELQREIAILHDMGEAFAKAWEADEEEVPDLMDAALDKWRAAYPCGSRRIID